MKDQIIFSPDATDGSSSSEPVKRLASRYGIPEKDVEALLYGSRAPKGETAGSDTKQTVMPEDYRPNYTIPPPRERGWSPLSVLSLVLGILGIMALAIIMIHVIKWQPYGRMAEHMPPPPMPQQISVPAPPQPQPAPADTMASAQKDQSMAKSDEVPPPAQSNEINAQARKPVHHGRSRSTGGYTTTNGMEAQEHLAEMRADGNSKAKIHTSSKNGMTIYTVK